MQQPQETHTSEGISINSEVSATELVAARAEIWLLTKNLAAANISIENLERLMKTLINQQNAILKEFYDLKRRNYELQEECRMQRDYHAMERYAMIRELHNIKLMLSERTNILEDTLRRNNELVSEVQGANEKIYVMGMKFLKLKAAYDGQCSEVDNSESSVE